jgi:prepilin peptidase CpaA
MMQLMITIIFLFIVSITDLKLNKVKNNHLLIFIIIAFGMNTMTLGFDGMMISLYGFIIPLIIGYPLFLLGLIPAGDIKLFMALGVMHGINATGRLLIITLLLGGLYSMLLLIKRKDLSGFISFYHYIKETIITRNLSSYDTKNSLRFPLAPVTFISYLLFIFLFDML